MLPLSATLGAILATQAGLPIDERWAFTVLAVAGSQVFTGATNDIADRVRDGVARPREAASLRRAEPQCRHLDRLDRAGRQLAASWQAGVGTGPRSGGVRFGARLQPRPVPHALSPIPYVVSFGLLPAWIAAGLGIPLERVLPAVPLVAPFAVAAHLANTVRDFEADAIGGSRSLAQVLGRQASRWIAAGLALAVGLGVGGALLIGGRATPASAGLGLLGLLAIVQGAPNERRLWYGILVAAVAGPPRGR